MLQLVVLELLASAISVQSLCFLHLLVWFLAPILSLTASTMNEQWRKMLENGSGGVDWTQESRLFKRQTLDGTQLKQGMGGGTAGQENNFFKSPQ